MSVRGHLESTCGSCYIRSVRLGQVVVSCVYVVFLFGAVPVISAHGIYLSMRSSSTIHRQGAESGRVIFEAELVFLWCGGVVRNGRAISEPVGEVSTSRISRRVKCAFAEPTWTLQLLARFSSGVWHS